MTSVAAYGQGAPVLHWSFDDNKDISFDYGDAVPEAITVEGVTGTECDITGLANYVPGVTGSALKFDGFSSQLKGNPFGHSNGEDLDLTLNGKSVPRGKAFRYRLEYDLEGNITLVARINVKTEESTRVSLSPVD